MTDTTDLIEVDIRQLIPREEVSTDFALITSWALQNELWARQGLIDIDCQILGPQLCTEYKKEILAFIDSHIIPNTQYIVLWLPEMALQKRPRIMYFPQMFEDRQLLIWIPQQLVQLNKVVLQLDIFLVLLLKLITERLEDRISQIDTVAATMQLLEFEVDREIVLDVEIQGFFLEVEQFQTGYRVLRIHVQFYAQVQLRVLLVFVDDQSAQLLRLVHPESRSQKQAQRIVRKFQNIEQPLGRPVVLANQIDLSNQPRKEWEVWVILL